MSGFIIVRGPAVSNTGLGVPCCVQHGGKLSDLLLWSVNCVTVFPTRAAARKAINSSKRAASDFGAPWAAEGYSIIRLVAPEERP